ncbi:hypothetical protein Bsp3421_000491 (plasmid) [Burkholderia sp. FERM BP-3421]|jgi:hypothetical protein|uniref:hypothetical protein n=1 Tax=Burkholderia sp. FERM BP-3421 TaxID=1494466 RepID=UPI0023624EC5|nr:hypothetical protein [Burkholderia sp. FERM BP-3421]WDD90627.1 hypothetical protein Bsp3421_000491 [Burkholderia sp. FERM BP-3421]
MPKETHIASQNTLATGFIIKPEDITGTQITFHYDSMPGNQPNTYGNTVFLWQTSQAAIPVNTAPYNSQLISGNQPNGSNVFMGISVSAESYLVAFATGNTVKNIVAAIFIPPSNGGPAKPVEPVQAPLLETTGHGSTSVSFRYATPIGMTPQNDGDWVGLWQGQGESVLYTLPPTWFAPIGSNANQGSWGLNLSSGNIQRGTMYTLGYFKGGYAQSNPKQATLAASTTFTG